MAECDVLSEIEVLQSIYLDELRVTRRDDGCLEVSLVLYPFTAQDSVSQFVRLTLTLTLDLQYPVSPPSISIHNPRGLSDDKLSSVKMCLETEAESCLGSPALYQLIEKAKEILTESNIPHGNCVICLYGFTEGEVFTKTSCYHYFHSHCLGRYITHSETELREREKELEEDKTMERTEQELSVVCPVCREALSYDVNQLLCTPAPCLPKLEETVIGADFRRKWSKLQKLLERQKANGGIIDPEVESNRFLIHVNAAPSDAENIIHNPDASPSQFLPCSPLVSTNEVTTAQNQKSIGTFHHKGWRGQWKGPRRGARGERQRGRPAHLTEHLNKLTLSLSEKKSHSYNSQTPVKGRFLNNFGLQNHEISEQSQLRKTEAEECTNVSHHEALISENKWPITQPSHSTLKTSCQRGLESVYGRGDQGSRRGLCGSHQQSGQWQKHYSQVGVDYNADGRSQTSRREGNSLHSKECRSSQGNDRSLHQRVNSEVVEEHML